MVTNPKAGPSVLFKLALLKRFVHLFEKMFLFSQGSGTVLHVSNISRSGGGDYR